MNAIAHSCSWCHRMNAVDVQTCPECGHDAQRARMDCRCPRCAAGQSSSIWPLDVADKVARDGLDRFIAEARERFGTRLDDNTCSNCGAQVVNGHHCENGHLMIRCY